MPHPAIAQIRFEEIARKAGLDFRLKNAASGQFHQVELMPGGVAAFDFDNDGCMDLYFTNGATGRPARRWTTRNCRARTRLRVQRKRAGK